MSSEADSTVPRGGAPGLKIATAPVSFGVYGAEPAGTGGWKDPDALLAAMASAGFEGTELGPPGYMGSPEETAHRLARHGLQAAGAYVAIRFGEPQHIDYDLEMMRMTLTELAVAGGGLAPAILADGGTDALLANPVRPWDDRSLALDAEGWRRLADVVKLAMEIAGEAGVPASFHPHTSTFVESPWEVERLLALTEVSLTLDTGHLFLAGVAATECLRAWKDRIKHIHIKDVHAEVLRKARDAERTDFDEWWADVCCPLGTGDVDLEPFLGELDEVGYEGWLVVEQDRAPTRVSGYGEVAKEQKANLAWLRARLRA